MHQAHKLQQIRTDQVRLQLEALVETAIDLLDQLDGDPDLELSECDEDGDEDENVSILETGLQR